MTGDRPLLGLLLMIGFCIAAPLGDAIAKLLGAAVPLVMLVGVRFAAQAILLAPLSLALGYSLRVPKGLWPIVILRALLLVAGVGMMFLALRVLPLADAIAIAYVMPFVVLLLGWALMGEEVGHRRLLSCIAGFGGTLLVMQPSFQDVGAAVLLPLGVAGIFSVFILVTRHIAPLMGPIELQAVNGIVGTAILVPVLVAGSAFGWAEASLVRPTPLEGALLVGAGCLGTLAHLLLTWSLRCAPASTVTPVQYLEIPVAVVLGLLLFGEFPTGLALFGILVVMLAGLYIILREHAVARSGRLAAHPARPPTPPAAG